MGRRISGEQENVMLYFAYGSNLDPNRSSAGLHAVRPAWLPESRLGFTRHSRGWNGGVLDVLPEPGGAVRGMLCSVDHPELLHAQEGPAYERIERTVLHDDGTSEIALLYVVRRRRPFVVPAEAYLALVRRAYERCGFPLAPLDYAAAGPSGETPPAMGIFVYASKR